MANGKLINNPISIKISFRGFFGITNPLRFSKLKMVNENSKNIQF